LLEDSRSTGTTRHLKYSSAAPGCNGEWEIFTIVPLCQQMKTVTEFRMKLSLSYPKAIFLVDPLPVGTNSDRGGFISSTNPPAHVTTPCHTLLRISLHPVPTQPADTLRAQASTFYNTLLNLFGEMRMARHSVGPQTSPAAFLDAKVELADYANTVNERVVSFTLMKVSYLQMLIHAISDNHKASSS
jgi:hypothetical protein